MAVALYEIPRRDIEAGTPLFKLVQRLQPPMRHGLLSERKGGREVEIKDGERSGTYYVKNDMVCFELSRVGGKKQS